MTDSMKDTEQREMRRSVAAFLDRHAPMTAVRAAMTSADGYDRALWRRAVDELGVTALLVPERLGGLGLTLSDAAVVVEEFGRRLVPGPVLTTLAATAYLAGCGTPEADEVLTSIAELGLSVSVAVNGGTNVVHGAAVDLLLVDTGDDVVVASDVVARHRVALDQTRNLADVEFSGGRRVGGAGLPGPLWTLLAAESAAAARTCLDLTVEYLKTREQFGRPIGSFQALKHRCADHLVAVEGAASTAWRATREPGEVPAALAKAVCTDVFFAVAADSVQLHGGIGFTWEHDAHLYLKRAKANQLLFGSSRALRDLVGTRVGL
ncbi:acyl-CoA dehydrogenase family protein [Actinosynnema sp. NPDC020468]|uniref:acyl-CoA dehydrogenase family protein n=1 Tax=Actinosynnema sp. NPDC020468 TaxID=3154488 RepID=UPI0033E587BC